MKIVCLGDSLTFGYQVPYKEKWHVIVQEKTGIKMVNRGRNGDTTDGMLERFQKDVIGARPDKMILMGGYNDIFFKRSWDKTRENIKVMVQLARDQTIEPIVAIPPPILMPVVARKEDEDIDFKKSNRMIEDYCHWLRDFVVTANLSFLDLRESIDWKDQTLYLDGVHQSAKGHHLIAEKVIKYLAISHFRDNLD